MLSRQEFKRKLKADLEVNTVPEENDLPEEMIERVTAGIEVNDLENKAKKLAAEIEKDTQNKSVSKPAANKDKEYFSVDVDTEAQVRGVKFREHTGIEITEFKCEIKTKSNAAEYDHCEVFLGNKDDNFDVWGKYTGEMKEAVNGKKEGQFEFYLRGNNLTVSYWKSHKYQDKAKKMASRAISLVKQALK